MSERKLYPYPLTIVTDRYSGIWAGGTFTAWNREPEMIPYEVCGDDSEALFFWEEYHDTYEGITDSYNVIGVGNTPEEAVDDLILKLKEKNIFVGIP